jgi:hypothetical protein
MALPDPGTQIVLYMRAKDDPVQGALHDMIRAILLIRNGRRGRGTTRCLSKVVSQGLGRRQPYRCFYDFSSSSASAALSGGTTFGLMGPKATLYYQVKQFAHAVGQRCWIEFFR